MHLEVEHSSLSLTVYKLWRDTIDTSFKLCSSELGLDRSNATIKFSVRAKNKMPRNTAGRTSRLFHFDNHISVQLNSTCFSSKREFLRVFCHEMIHVQQEISGDLLDTIDGGTVWRNQKFSKDAVLLAQLPFVPEDTLPWERDAYTRGPELAYKIAEDVPWPSHKWWILLAMIGAVIPALYRYLIQKLMSKLTR